MNVLCFTTAESHWNKLFLVFQNFSWDSSQPNSWKCYMWFSLKWIQSSHEWRTSSLPLINSGEEGDLLARKPEMEPSVTFHTGLFCWSHDPTFVTINFILYLCKIHFGRPANRLCNSFASEGRSHPRLTNLCQEAPESCQKSLSSFFVSDLSLTSELDPFFTISLPLFRNKVIRKLKKNWNSCVSVKSIKIKIQIKGWKSWKHFLPNFPIMF